MVVMNTGDSAGAYRKLILWNFMKTGIVQSTIYNNTANYCRMNRYRVEKFPQRGLRDVERYTHCPGTACQHVERGSHSG